jgi:hypothetical protein
LSGGHQPGSWASPAERGADDLRSGLLLSAGLEVVHDQSMRSEGALNDVGCPRERFAVSTTDASVVSWLEMTGHRIRDLLTAADDASRHQRSGHDQAVAAVHEFRSSVHSLQRWSIEHPCPDPAFVERFELLLARYGFISLITDDDTSTVDGTTLSTAVDRLRVLNDDLKAFLDDLEEHQREESFGEPLD